jgi:hypothetical protein
LVSWSQTVEATTRLPDVWHAISIDEPYGRDPTMLALVDGALRSFRLGEART